MLGYLVLVAVSGLIVGALGRLALPGPQPMSLLWTMALGIGGSLLAGVIGQVLFGDNHRAGLLLSVACTTLLVWLFTRRAQKPA